MRFLTAFLFAAFALVSLPLQAAPLQPHSVTYDFKLIRASSGAGIADAAGQMTYRMEDACRGWSAEQKATITMVFAEGLGSFDFGWSLESWESKDGAAYRFFLKRLTGDEREEYAGSARLSDLSAEVTSDGGEAQPVALMKGTLFPMAFTEKAIAKAEAGEVLLASPLYDGGPSDELYEVSMILGKELPEGADLPAEGLEGLRSWEARAAFFKQNSGQSEPDQEQSFRLFENGVIDRLVLDMGDFAIEGRISAYEELPGCE